MNQPQDITTGWPEDASPIPFFKAGELSELEEYRLLKQIVGEVLCQQHPHVIKMHACIDNDGHPTGEIGISVLRMIGENRTWSEFNESKILQPFRWSGGGDSAFMTLEEFFNRFHPDRQGKIYVEKSDLMDRAWFFVEKAVKQLQDVHLSQVDKYQTKIEFTGSDKDSIPGGTQLVFRNLVTQVMDILKREMDKEAKNSRTNATFY